MSATGRLSLRLEEPGDDALNDQVFETLQTTLHPDCQISLDTAVDQLVGLLHSGQTYTSEVTTFLCGCYEVAEQIPYSHPSMDKLVTIIYPCLNSATFTGGEISQRYQKLGESLYHWLTGCYPVDGPARYVNFHAFAALIFERGMCDGSAYANIVWFDATKDQEAHSNEERNAYMQAMSQWLRIYGKGLFKDVEDGYLSREKWRSWHEQLSAVAEMKGDVKYDSETIELAGQACVVMDEAERSGSGRDHGNHQSDRTRRVL